MTRPNIILALALCVIAAAVISLHVGLRFYGPAQVVHALFGGADDTDALIIRTLRLPRMAVAITCGAALALSGLLMQTATRNPLAEPGLLGVNAGAALAAVIGVTFFGATGLLAVSAIAALGAVVAVAVVFGISMMGDVRFDPASILLAGVTLAALCGALSQVILLSHETAFETLLFWLAGSFADRDIRLVWIGAPVVLLGIVATIRLAPSLDALRADDDTAAALGVPVLTVRVLSLALAALLAGVSVALAGPVIFIGLIAPHLVTRLLPGATHGWLALACPLAGALLALLADMLARIIVAPAEAPMGTVLALVGVPALVILLRRSGARQAA
ncbi:iron ABC transporter permease [Paracoccus aurantiacus]|uniref:Iron ABC transporter permease n=1 Tax=Paracoccus aurantiacus TaxID=2599412 RepID=A0A5C6S7M6_9RHOB|nr:iron ABC transporter permease [Paracoccus aurantiacus]TXB70354.1 iron ABC transporter permease [Paracoccus aurantiacus]